MPEAKKNWFGLITDKVLVRAGPGKNALRGADIYAGQVMPPPGDQLTVDVLDKAEKNEFKG